MGKVYVRNIRNGKSYNASVDCLRPPSADVLPYPVEPRRPVVPAPIAARLLQPDEDGDRRTNPEYKERAKLLPLSMDELTAYTALSAINKTLNTLHLNRDSFRNPRLFDLIRAAHCCLDSCIKEMEAYRELPENA